MIQVVKRLQHLRFEWLRKNAETTKGANRETFVKVHNEEERCPLFVSLHSLVLPQLLARIYLNQGDSLSPLIRVIRTQVTVVSAERRSEFNR